MEHEYFMGKALELAAQSMRENEVPVGCVIVKGSEIVGRGRNRREAKKSALSHAEIEAIERACASTGDWRLTGCSLYVTLEPCPMCAGAIINARIPAVCFGAKDPSFGACGSVLNLFEEDFGHRPSVIGGIMADECTQLLRRFFDGLRS